MKPELFDANLENASVMTSAVSPSLLTAVEVARLLAVSVRTLWRLDSSCQLPQAVKVGQSKRWRRDELVAWINTGCPARSNWRWEEIRRLEKSSRR